MDGLVLRFVVLFSLIGVICASEFDSFDYDCKGKGRSKMAMGPCEPKYVQCHKGKPEVIECWQDEVFDESTGECALQEEVDSCKNQTATIDMKDPNPERSSDHHNDELTDDSAQSKVPSQSIPVEPKSSEEKDGKSEEGKQQAGNFKTRDESDQHQHPSMSESDARPTVDRSKSDERKEQGSSNSKERRDQPSKSMDSDRPTVEPERPSQAEESRQSNASTRTGDARRSIDNWYVIIAAMAVSSVFVKTLIK